MNFDLSRIQTSFLTNELIPSIFSDQAFNLVSLGAFLLVRRRVLLKTYTQNKISSLGKMLLQYEKKNTIKGSVQYAQKTGKYILTSILGCSFIQLVEKCSNTQSKLKIEELIKPVLLFKIFHLNLLLGLSLGLVNLTSKYLLYQNLKQFM